MYVENLRIEHFGQLNDACADGLHRQLNILWCSRDSERDDSRDFLRWLLFGTTEATPGEFGMQGANGTRACGSMSVLQNDRRHQIRRLDDGTRYGRLSLDGLHDESTRDATFQLGRITPHEFDVIFAPRLDLDPHPEQLLDAFRSAHFDFSPRRIPSERRGQLTARLEQLRAERERLPWSDSVAHLLERRSVLTRRIEQATQQQQRQREDLDNEYRDLSQRIEQLGQEIDRLRREYQARDDEVKRRRHELQETWHIAQQAKESFLRQRREELAELETRTNRWQGILHEIEQRLADVDDQLRHKPLTSGPPKGPTCLVENLAAQLDQLRRDVANRVDYPTYADGSRYEAVTGQETRTALDDLRSEVSRLCQALQDHQQNDKHRWLESEVDYLCQCENLMTSWLAKLQEQRDRLHRELSDAERTGLSLVDDGDPTECGPSASRYIDWDSPYARDSYSRGPYGDVHRNDSIARRTTSRSGLIRAVAHSCDGHDVIHPDTDSFLKELIVRRDTISRELEERQRAADSLVVQRADIDGRIDRLSSRELDDIRRELEEIELGLHAAERHERLAREIVHVEDELRYEKDQLQPAPVVDEASRILHQLTQGRFGRVRIDDSRHITVDDSRGSVVNLRAAAEELRTDVYLALCLALVAAYHREGIKLPSVMIDPFLLTDAGHAATRASVIHDFAKAGHQVLLLTSRRHVNDLFRGSDFTFVELQPGRDLRPLPAPSPEPLPERRITEPERDGEFEDHVRFRRRAHTAQPGGVPFAPSARPRASMPSTSTDTSYTTTSGLTASQRFEPAGVHTNSGDTRRVAETLTEETHSLSLSSSIDATGVIDAAVAARLDAVDIKTVREFLELDSQDLIEDLAQAGFATSSVRRWQDELALRCWVVGLTAEDATLLVSCGIEDVGRLAEMESDQLYDVLTRSMRSQQQASYSADRFEELRERTHFWVRAARRSRTDWDRFRIRTYGKRKWRRNTDSHDADSSQDSLTSLRSSESPARDPAGPSTRTGVPTSPATETAPSNQRTIRFLLDSDDPLVDAPSIGPRTAAHFQKIGVRSVADFLRLNPQDAAAQIDNRRIKANTIDQWQKQAALACRIPSLRGHDAQILVACGVKDPTELARMEPAELWARVKPFVETAEGKRIIRNGKTPDLKEIEDWIYFATKSRTMKAA